MDPVAAAEHAICMIRLGRPVGTDVLTVIASAAGYSTEFLRRRRRIGFCLMVGADSAAAIAILEDFIEDRQAERFPSHT